MKYKFKLFTPDEWNMYQGAEGEPEVCYTRGKLGNKVFDLTIVVDDNGINLDYGDKSGWQHDFNFETDGKQTAKTVLRLLELENATVEGLQAVGFTYVDLREGE